MNIIAQTARLVIREFVPGEEMLFVNLYHDERVTRLIPKRTDEESKRKFAEALKDYQNRSALSRWGVFTLADGDFIGFCMLKPAEAAPEQIELGYVLAYKYWGAGMATEISRALITYGFEQRGLSEICACTNPANIASQNVLLKAGFNREGNVDWYGGELPFFRIRKT